MPGTPLGTPCMCGPRGVCAMQASIHSLSLPRRAAKYAIKTRATRELQPGQGVNSIAVKCGKAESNKAVPEGDRESERERDGNNFAYNAPAGETR